MGNILINLNLLRPFHNLKGTEATELNEEEKMECGIYILLKTNKYSFKLNPINITLLEKIKKQLGIKKCLCSK
jgi:hypothetical protein